MTLFSFPYHVAKSDHIIVKAKDLINLEAYEYCTPLELDTTLVFKALYPHTFHNPEGVKETLIEAWRKSPRAGLKLDSGPTYQEWWNAPEARFYAKINDKTIPPDTVRTIRFPQPIYCITEEEPND